MGIQCKKRKILIWDLLGVNYKYFHESVKNMVHDFQWSMAPLKCVGLQILLAHDVA